MEALFKRYFWIVQVLGLAGGTALAASALTTGIGSALLLSPNEPEEGVEGTDADSDDEEDDGTNRGGNVLRPKPSAARSATSVRAAKERAAEQIQKFNVFCPTCVPEDPNAVSEAVGDTNPVGVGLQPGEAKTSLPLRLHATMIADNSAYSWATISHTETGTVGAYRPKDAISEGVVVVSIDPQMVHLRNRANLEYLQLGDAAPPTRSSTKVEKDDASSKPKSSNSPPGAEEAIKCPSDDLCVVERAYVEQLIANPMQLAKQAKVLPAKDGEVGFKFYGIRRGSLPRLLGMKNGDRVVAINGEELTSIDQVMGLYAKLRRASNLSVTIDRKGQTLNKEIQIQ